MGKGRSAIFIQTIHLPKSPAMLEDIQELGNVMCYCGYIFGAVGGQTPQYVGTTPPTTNSICITFYNTCMG